MVMLEPLISLIVCSCLGGPGLSPLTNHRSLRQGGQGSQGEWKERGRQEEVGGGETSMKWREKERQRRFKKGVRRKER